MTIALALSVPNLGAKLLYRGTFVVVSLGPWACDKPAPATQPKEAETSAAAAEVSLDGVDTSVLTPRERKEFSSYVTQFLAPCPDTPVPIAQCVKEKRACGSCVAAARYIVKGVRTGYGRDQIEKAYKNRFDPANVKDVPIEGSPCTGPENAPVTIIEFADFECPACSAMAPRVHAVVEENKTNVRFCYKFYPLPSHTHGEPAAKAGVAAWNQGKFWEMHDVLFKNQQHLEQGDLEGYARDLRLDLARFRADMTTPAVADRVQKDKKLGERVGVQGTPSIFINGRLYDPMQDLADWIAQELSSAGKKADKPSDAGATSADSGASALAKDAGAKK